MLTGWTHRAVLALWGGSELSFKYVKTPSKSTSDLGISNTDLILNKIAARKFVWFFYYDKAFVSLEALFKFLI